MINVKELQDYRQALGFFSQQLHYPEKLTFHPNAIEGIFQVGDPAYEHVQKYWDRIQAYSMDEIEEIYTNTFDFQKDSTLHMTYFTFEDARERGQMLAKLKTMYEMFGLEMVSNEIPDYLPLMCEFLYVAQTSAEKNLMESLELCMAVLEDGTYHLLKSLEKEDNVYYYLVKGLRETLKACIRKGDDCS